MLDAMTEALLGSGVAAESRTGCEAYAHCVEMAGEVSASGLKTIRTASGGFGKSSQPIKVKGAARRTVRNHSGEYECRRGRIMVSPLTGFWLLPGVTYQLLDICSPIYARARSSFLQWPRGV